jgi:hypothetical protein
MAYIAGQHDEDYESGSDDGEEGEMVERRIAGQIAADGHLQAEDLYGVQTKIFNMSCSGSLEELAANPSKAKWQMSSEMQKLLRQVTSTTNRSKAGEEQLAGNLSKAVLLHCSILEQRNDYPVAIGVNIPGMVPQVYDRTSRYNWIIENNTPTTLINQPIFDPDNVFTRYMYEKLQKLDMASLNDQIRFEKDPNAPHAHMDPNGFAWQIMMKNVHQGKFQGADDHLLALNDSVQYNSNVLLKVPVAIAREVYEAIKEPLQKIESSFVDLRKLECTFTRVNNEPWNSISGLIGETVGMGHDSQTYMQETNLTAQKSASIKVQIKYIVY